MVIIKRFFPISPNNFPYSIFKNIQSERVKLNIKSAEYYNYDSILILNPSTPNLTIELSSKEAILYDLLKSNFNKKGALKDIKNNEIKLLLPGGLIGSSITPSDTLFENKYKLTFISQGCVRLKGDNETEYNKEIFKYLDNKLGTSWRFEIRKDVIGMNN